jgi:uncharacterized SAM-dependent methyltransferase
MSVSLQIEKRPEHSPLFLKDASDFFAEKRLGHMGYWRYSEPLFSGDKVNGMHHWAEFVKSARNGNAYYVYNDEVEVIQNSVLKIQKEIQGPITLIDLGPGSKEALIEKPGFLISSLEGVNSYVGVDIVPDLLIRIQKIVEENYPHLQFFGFNKDFFHLPLSLPISGTGLMVIFGQTMLNLPIDPFDAKLSRMMMTGMFKKLRADWPQGACFIATQDCTQDSKDLVEA